MVQVAPSPWEFLTKVTMGVAALRWIIIEVPHMSYKQARCVFTVTQRKSIGSESFMVLWFLQTKKGSVNCVLLGYKLYEFCKQRLAPTKVFRAVLWKTFSSSDTTDAITASMRTSWRVAIVVFKKTVTSTADPSNETTSLANLKSNHNS